MGQQESVTQDSAASFPAPLASDATLEDMRARYTFLGKMIDKVPALAGRPEMHEAGLRAYHEARMETRSAVLGPEDMPGWRRVVAMQSRGSLFFAGVRADGLVIQGRRDPEARELFVPKSERRVEGTAFVERVRDTAGKLSALVDEHPDQREGAGGNIRTDEWLHLAPRSRKRADLLGNHATAFTTRVARSLEDAGAKSKDTKRFFQPMKAVMMRQEERRFTRLRGRLVAALDPEVKHIAHATASWGSGFLGWLSGATMAQGRLRGDPDLAARRRQAVRAFPLFARAMHDDHRSAVRSRDEGDEASPRDHGAGTRPFRIASAIDTGAPLVPALAEQYRRFGVTPNHVKRLQGVTWQKAGRTSFYRPDVLLTHLARIDINHVPTTRRGFADLAAVSTAAEACQSVLPDAEPAAMMREVSGRIPAIASLLEGNPASGMSDMAEHLHDKIVVPGLVQKRLAAGASREEAAKAGLEMMDARSFPERKEIMRGHTMRTGLTASSRWHRALPRLIAEFGAEGSNTRWDPLLGETTDDSGRQTRELTSEADLRVQGEREGHCVGGYGPAVRAGDTLIFSNMDARGRILSTVEVMPHRDDAGKWVFKPVQDMAARNREPGKTAKAMTRRLVRTLSALPHERVDAYMEKLAAQEAERRRDKTPQERLVEKVGYDPTDPEMLEKAWAAHAEYLPRGVRKKGFGAFIDTHVAQYEARRAQSAARRPPPDRAAADILF